MDSQGYYQRELEGCFAEVEKNSFGDPYEAEIDLFVTGTNVYGRVFTEFDDEGHPVDVKDHRSIFMLSYRGDRKNEFHRDNIRALAKLARITSCFPVAFEPVHVASADGTGLQNPVDGPVDDTLRRWGRLTDEAYFMDGGVLDNKPFSYTIDAIFGRLADRPVSRLLLYIEPDPERFARSKRIDMPTVVAAATDALIGIPGYESIAGDLQAITSRNNKLAQYDELAGAVQRKALDFLGQDGVKDTDGLRQEDSTRIKMYLLSRLAQLRDRALLGIIKERGELRLLTNERRHAAKILVESFGMMTSGGEDAWQTLESFDVYYRLRRLFHVVYKIHETLSDASTKPEIRSLYTDVWQSINHQIKLLEIVRFAMETVIDNSAIAVGDLSGRRAGEDLAAEKWGAVKNILHDLLLPQAVLTRKDLDEAELVRLFMEDDQDGMRVRIRQLRDAKGTARRNEQGSILFELDRQQREILLRLKPGDAARDAFCGFIIIDSYLFAMQRTAGIEATDIIRTVRISPIDAQRGFSNAPLDRKLCGNQLGHFGGFLKGSWRANDIMWGRLDAVCQLTECLLTPERILQLSRGGGKAATRVSNIGLDLAEMFPGANRKDLEDLQVDLDSLEAYAQEHVDAHNPKESRFSQFLSRLVLVTQGPVFDEEIPTVLKTAIKEQVDWNNYRVPHSGVVPFNTERQVWATGVKKIDRAVLAYAQSELMTNIKSATPGFWRRYFEQGKYNVGEEVVLEAIPAPILLEMTTHSSLILENCLLAAAGPKRSQRIRDNVIYRFGLSYPVRAAYGFARFQRSAPEFAKSAIVLVATLALTLIIVGVWRWNQLIDPPSGFVPMSFLWFIGFPAFALFLMTTLFRGVRILGLVLSVLVAVFTLIILIHFNAVDPQSTALKSWGVVQRVVQFIADNRKAIVVGSMVSLVLTIPFGRMWTALRLALNKVGDQGSAKK
jgi:patatin-related protein